jgi:hypothetical protein
MQTTMQVKSFAMAATLVLLLAVPVAAHEGHQHRYMGTIATATDSQLSLKTTDGKTISFKLDETTKIRKGETAGGVKDLVPGARAVVEADGGKEPALAKTIRLAAEKPKTTS